MLATLNLIGIGFEAEYFNLSENGQSTDDKSFFWDTKVYSLPKIEKKTLMVDIYNKSLFFTLSFFYFSPKKCLIVFRLNTFPGRVSKMGARPWFIQISSSLETICYGWKPSSTLCL